MPICSSGATEPLAGEIRSPAQSAPSTHGVNHNDATVVEVPGLNHLFQTAGSGAPIEYARIEETISPAALDLITDWVVKRAAH